VIESLPAFSAALAIPDLAALIFSAYDAHRPHRRRFPISRGVEPLCCHFAREAVSKPRARNVNPRSLPPIWLRLRLPWKLTSDESNDDDAPWTAFARGAKAQKNGAGKQTGTGKQAVTWMFSAYRQRTDELWTGRSAKVVLCC
jgi:hypothetical protein